MKKIIHSIIFVIALVFVLGPAAAYACSCLAQPEKTEIPRDWLKNFNGAVFEGRVAKIERAAKSQYLLKVTFTVERYWKGVKTKQAFVYTASQSAMCGVPFERGRKYLVFAEASEGRFQASLCPWTEKEQNEALYRAYLGRGRKPGER
jgi:hypothetical protein